VLALWMWIWRVQTCSYDSRSESGAVVVAAEVLQTNSSSERVVMGVGCNCTKREKSAPSAERTALLVQQDSFQQR
jgi:hypothetical protein